MRPVWKTIVVVFDSIGNQLVSTEVIPQSTRHYRSFDDAVVHMKITCMKNCKLPFLSALRSCRWHKPPAVRIGVGGLGTR